MEIKQEAIDNAGRFYIEKDGETLAEIDYELPNKTTILITHTEVSDKLSGKGIGRQLVSAAVNYARNKSLALKSTCSFAKAVLDKTHEFADVYTTEKNKS